MSEGDTNEPDHTGTLRRRLTEAEETLVAIRAGEVDAVVVEGPEGQQVYTLETPDEPFRLFVEQMQEGALTLNGDGTIVYCNPFFAHLVKQPLDNVRGRELVDFIAPEHRQSFQRMLDGAVHDVVHGESYLQVNGAERVSVQLAFNRLPAEHVRMFGVVITDLTERARAQELDAKRRAAEQAKSARDHFLAVVSHELRSPLNAILGWTQVLRRRDELPAAAQQGLEVIERNAWAQSQLIEDLLDVSRVLAGKLRLNLKPIELTAVIKAAVASVQPTAESRRVHISLKLPQTPSYVQGDGDRLQQVVWNLLSNAVKFSSEGGVVHVRLSERDGFADIVVADSGIGIRPEFLARLFEPYQQIEGSTTRRSGGLGLGLAIAKQLTELHGGEIHADSTGEGRGASFTIRLALLPLDGREPESEAAAPESGRVIHGTRLLVVEDHQDAREMLTHVLTSAGAAVSTATTAVEALEVLERNRYDLLIGDIGLPETDGYELIRRIRASGLSGRDLPAIAVTAFAGREDRRQALLAGYQVHLSKPIDQDELIAAVANLVEGPTEADS